MHVWVLIVICSRLFSAISLDQVRNEFAAAVNDSDRTEALYDKLKEVTVKAGTLYAYKGAVVSLKAKHAWNPHTKLEHLANASAILNEAISYHPGDIESRYLRLSVEMNVPSYLGYTKHLAEDKKAISEAIISQTHTISDHLTLKNIARFMVKNAKLDTDTAAKIKAAAGI